jgi:hypothetical protein
MKPLKHLPKSEWPEADHAAFRAVYAPGDVFDETTGPGAHLSDGTRRFIGTTWRRWLGFLACNHPRDLGLAPADRITPERVRHYVEHLSAEVRLTTVATGIDGLHYGARLIAPERDWRWLKALKRRLDARARPLNRFAQLVPGLNTLDYGIALMDKAIETSHGQGEHGDVLYRDGLLLALLSLWPIRRRSLAALTVSRHILRDDDSLAFLLHPEDTKAKRSESFKMPDKLVPHVLFYLDAVRPRLLGDLNHDGFWASSNAERLTGQSLYAIARRRVLERYGKAMGLHDFRRAAGTYLAIDAPEMLGLLPGILQHASPDVGEQSYNLANRIAAGQRHAAHVSKLKSGLKPAANKSRT